MINSVLGDRYTILENIGVGGMSVVYKAVDSVENRFVAIKVLKPEFLSDQRFRRRFLNESRAIAMLSHINIVDVYDVNFEGEVQYIVMEFIEGRTLKEYIDFTGAIPINEAMGYIKQILRALRQAHERGIIHRDIKPQNIMLLDDGTIKVMDFGIAHVSNFETITMTDMAMGSVHYFSPEQARGFPTDEKSDIYATGVVLYEMLTGVLPFTGGSPVSVAIMQVQNEPKRPREIKPDLPIGIEQIILHAIKKDPEKRYQHVKEMLVDIKIFEDNKDWIFEYKDDSANKIKTETQENLSEESKSDENKEEAPEEIQQKTKKTEKEKNSANKTSKPKKQKVSAKGRKWQVVRNKFLAIISGIFLAFVIVIVGLGVMFTVVEQLNEDLIELPNLVGQVATDVMANPSYSIYFTFTTENRYDDTIGTGLIVEQSHEPGKYSKGTEIKLVVSIGKRTVTVPNVTGWDDAQAIVKLKQTDLLHEIIRMQSDTVDEGKVIRTDPISPTTVPVGTSIKIYVSYKTEFEKAFIPKVIGYSESQAKQNLNNAQFYYISVREVYDDEVLAGFVVSLNYEEGEAVEKSAEIIINVSKGSIADAIANGTYETGEESEDYDYVDDYES